MVIPPEKSRQHDQVDKGTLIRLIRYTFAYKRLLLTGLVLLLLATGADVLGPILIKVFIDDYLLPGHWDWQELTALLACYVVANIAAAWLGFRETIRFNDIAQRVVFTLRQSLFRHILYLPIRRFDFTPVGSVVSRITNDTETIKELFVGVLGVYLRNIVKVSAIFIAMAILNLKLMLICALFVPVVIALMWLYRKLSTKVFNRARQLLSDINGSLNETLQGAAVIQLFHQERRFAKAFSQLNRDYFRTRTRTMQMDALLLRPMVDMLQLLTLAGLLYGFGVISLNSPVEIGVLYAFVNYLGRFIEPLIEMTQRLNLFQQAIVSAARVFRWMDEPAEPDESDVRINISNRHISISQLDFSYEPDKPVLKQLNMDIPEGSFLGVVGHTGSGKSTLANLLMGFYQPDSGSVTLGGVPLSRIPRAFIRKTMAIVQQDSFIFRGTIADNIAIGRQIDREQIARALEEVGILNFVESLPGGLDYVLSEKGANLSYGQRQMISFARALAGEPDILILDEATANVDSETERKIQQSLSRVAGRRTVIAIAHRLSTITRADTIIVLHQGEIVQSGHHGALMAEDGLYRHLYELQHLASGSGALPKLSR
ncbi:MAG: ABC transporter transmembrane domain-containing protein [Ketobacteraceae bacterium]|nr:ABC transporter transmembrane domain-containing protein [Ketobacteraceae bacterium]